jgi:hypothetical protein
MLAKIDENGRYYAGKCGKMWENRGKSWKIGGE